ncbi:MAG: metallophosphoesterase family protein [Actinomycetota bacterium]
MLCRGKSNPARNRGAATFILCAFLSVLLVMVPLTGVLAGQATGPSASAVGAFNPVGSLPEVAKRINQLIYPTFGYPAIVPRGGKLVIEWDWRKGLSGAPWPDIWSVNRPEDWEVWVTTSVAANVQNYDGAVPGSPEEPPIQWYRLGGPSYGTYPHPVHTVVNIRRLRVLEVKRGPSKRWPEIFGQPAFEVDHVEVEMPLDVPLDLYDLHVRCLSGRVDPAFRVEDQQPHALQVIDAYRDDLKIVHITDTHVYGPEIKNGLNLDYNSFELREPRPGTPSRIDLSVFGYPGFPMDLDGDGKANEGAIYLQEELQAINLINPDFVVFTGDCVYAQKNFNTYPKDTWLWGDVNGDPGSEYRFEYTWWYDELLALNVPVFCVPGNHDSYCWDGHALVRDDGQEIWQDLFGPLYYSWDYGDMTFLAVNTMDWDKVDADGPEPFRPENTNPLLWALATSLFPDIAWDYDDRGGFLADFTRIFLPLKVIIPHKWHGQVRGDGDPWEWEPWPWGPDPDGDGFSGQLAWVERELRRATAEGKRLKGAFMHHDPLRPAGSPPEAFDNAKEFGLMELASGEGEGSQALMYLFRKYEVSFVATGHTHSDAINRVPWAPYGSSPGEVVCINTTAAEIPVDGNSFLLKRASEGYAGYRLITVRDCHLSDWGFAGAEGDPDRRWSIPGWEGLRVGAGEVNDYTKYRSGRPVLQWMEQEDSESPAYSRPPIIDGEGAFDRPLPLNVTGPYSRVTCRIKNTLNQSGAVLNLSGCRLEIPMKYLAGGAYYAARNGRVLEQYDADSGERMVVVLADVPGGAVLPVEVYVAGRDRRGPVVDEARINDGSGVTDRLEVTLNLRARDRESGLMDLRVSNRPDFAGATWIPCRDGQPLSLPWRLEEGPPGWRYVYVQFRDAAMPGNLRTVRLRVRYLPSP